LEDGVMRTTLLLLAAMVAFPASLFADPDNLTQAELHEMQKLDAVTIPGSCQSPFAMVDMQTQISSLLQLGNNTAQITNILAEPNLLAYQYDQTHWRIDCYITLNFSNGLVQTGKFSEWQNQYDQKMVSFDPDQ
jgi:hypothetical protein